MEYGVLQLRNGNGRKPGSRALRHRGNPEHNKELMEQCELDAEFTKLLQEHKKDSEKRGLYGKAKDAEAKVQLLKSRQKCRHLVDTFRKHQQQWDDFNDRFRTSAAMLKERWDELDHVKFKEQLETMQGELREKHQAELCKLKHQQVENATREANKGLNTTTIQNLRYRTEQLARQGFYTEAEQLSATTRNMEAYQAERGALQRRRVERQQIQQLRNRQQQEQTKLDDKKKRMRSQFESARHEQWDLLRKQHEAQKAAIEESQSADRTALLKSMSRAPHGGYAFPDITPTVVAMQKTLNSNPFRISDFFTSHSCQTRLATAVSPPRRPLSIAPQSARGARAACRPLRSQLPKQECDTFRASKATATYRTSTISMSRVDPSTAPGAFKGTASGPHVTQKLENLGSILTQVRQAGSPACLNIETGAGQSQRGQTTNIQDAARSYGRAFSLSPNNLRNTGIRNGCSKWRNLAQTVYSGTANSRGSHTSRGDTGAVPVSELMQKLLRPSCQPSRTQLVAASPWTAGHELVLTTGSEDASCLVMEDSPTAVEARAAIPSHNYGNMTQGSDELKTSSSTESLFRQNDMRGWLSPRSHNPAKVAFNKSETMSSAGMLLSLVSPSDAKMPGKCSELEGAVFEKSKHTNRRSRSLGHNRQLNPMSGELLSTYVRWSNKHATPRSRTAGTCVVETGKYNLNSFRDLL